MSFVIVAGNSSSDDNEDVQEPKAKKPKAAGDRDGNVNDNGNDMFQQWHCELSLQNMRWTVQYVCCLNKNNAWVKETTQVQ